MKLEEKDLYFVGYYYLKEFHGTYPVIKESDEILMKHCLRKVLNIKDQGIEMQIINLLYHEDANSIEKMTRAMFPELGQRTDSHERILFLYSQIQNIRKGVIAEQKEEQKEKENGLPEGAMYDSIEEYLQATGKKRYRMTKEQAIRGMNREDAFRETYGGQED